MPRLACAARDMQDGYDVVVIGSGYGGGVAASRMARAGLSVCVLERGREFLPGDFPDKLLSSQREMQVSGGTFQFGSSTALFDLRMGDGVHMLSGCGLGGTSLINANVCLTPHEAVLEAAAWPERLRYDPWLNLGYYRARKMLQPTELPATSTPHKLAALEAAAKSIGREVSRVPLHITFKRETTAAGVAQRACTQCGDCMGGCNVGAKTTVHSTYLCDAVNHGAQIFTTQLVRFIEQAAPGTGAWNSAGSDAGADRRWRVVMSPSGAGKEGVVARHSVYARHVVVAAGTLGTAEIMMRSGERGLALSPRLGKQVSTNADMIALGYNNDIAVNAMGTGKRVRHPEDQVGPGVCGMIDLRPGVRVNEQLVVVEAAIQSAMAPLMPWLLAGGDLTGSDMDTGFTDTLRETARTLESMALGAYRGAAANTQTFLAVGDDGARGEIRFEKDRARIVWPDAARLKVFSHIEQTIKKLVAATGGTYIPNPVMSRLLGGNLLTVHPLGGCAMGDTINQGVVDHQCRVFDGGASGLSGGAAPGDDTSIHNGLYICDGSVIPRPLGVHPLMTITAVAERAMALFMREHGLKMAGDGDVPVPRRDFVSQTISPARGE